MHLSSHVLHFRSMAPTPLPEISSILFDLDGTLIDTEPSAAQAIRDSFAKWGIQINASDATYVTGRTWASAFVFLFEKYSLPIPEAQAENEILGAYRERIQEKLHIVPGSVQAVKSLAQRYRLGLVSGSHRQEILWALKKLGIFAHFQVILGAEDYPKSKPEPDGYLKAFELFQASPRSSLIFEDSQAGIASARRAGAWVVAITGTNHFRQNTKEAHHEIPDLSCVTIPWVENLMKNFKNALQD